MSHSSARVPRKATYADLEALSDRYIGEIVGGDLYASPRPRLRHAVAATRLTVRLGPPFDEGSGGPGGWWILIEPELHFGTDVVVPDLAGWRRERLPVVPDAAYLELAPDWVCEIVSPSTERIDRGSKLGIYARERVLHVWLLNPDAKTLEVLKLQGEQWLVAAVHTGASPVRAEPFDAVELDLAGLWGETPS
ncbi:MAG: Uma2 family endonuclease [Vicinamibacteria bacterium]